MITVFLTLLFVAPLMLSILIGALLSGKSTLGRSCPRPSGPRKIISGKPIIYKHGQKVMAGSIDEFINNKCRSKYYNKHTDDFQDEKPE